MSEEEKKDSDIVETGISATVEDDKIKMFFDSPVKWLAFEPEQARTLGQALINLADLLEKSRRPDYPH